MSISPPTPVSLKEGRFARFEAIQWWKQPLVASARVLVIGAGALGNEVVKDLALLGVGQLLIVDMDRIEASNLSRSVLFRESDEGQHKATCAARAAREIYPSIRAEAIVGNVLADVGLGAFRWANVVLGALDNREARVFVNSACARVGRPWIDGGIDVLHGIVRGFNPPATACYECTMGKADWDLLNKRRSCSLLARRAAQERGTPTTPTTASIIAALQVQEVLKLIHGMDALMGKGLVFDGMGHASFTVGYPKREDCPWHDPPASVEELKHMTSQTPLVEIWAEASRLLGGVDALDLSREIVEAMECPACGGRREVFQPAEKVGVDQAICPECRTEAAPVFVHSIGAGSPLLSRTPASLGLPPWDILWARRGMNVVGLEISGDAPQTRSK